MQKIINRATVALLSSVLNMICWFIEISTEDQLTVFFSSFSCFLLPESYHSTYSFRNMKMNRTFYLLAGEKKIEKKKTEISQSAILVKKHYKRAARTVNCFWFCLHICKYRFADVRKTSNKNRTYWYVWHFCLAPFLKRRDKIYQNFVSSQLSQARKWFWILGVQISQRDRIENWKKFNKCLQNKTKTESKIIESIFWKLWTILFSSFSLFLL